MAAEGKEVAQEKGMSIFLDVFCRADKNDDSQISWEEFKSFFADGVLSHDELSKLFNDMDTHNTNNIDTGELCSYFAKHLGPFKEIFAALEGLNTAMNKALEKSAAEYESSGLMEQFMTRFLLRELVHQVSATRSVLDTASDSLDEQALKQRVESESEGSEPQMSRDEIHTPSKKIIDVSAGEVDLSTIVPGRFARRARRQLSTQTSWTVESGAGGGNLQQQVERLRHLVDKLENKVNLDGVTDEQTDIREEDLLVLVRRKLNVNESLEKPFRSSLKSYIESTNDNKACLHLGVRSYAGSPLFVLYEIWESEEAWKDHAVSQVHKKFQHSNIDNLETPASLNTMLIPSGWWKRD